MNELVFAHTVRDPLSVVHGQWVSTDPPELDYFILMVSGRDSMRLGKWQNKSYKFLRKK